MSNNNPKIIEVHIGQLPDMPNWYDEWSHNHVIADTVEARLKELYGKDVKLYAYTKAQSNTIKAFDSEDNLIFQDDNFDFDFAIQALKKSYKPKWALHIGCHNGTMPSSDIAKMTYDNREKAFEAYLSLRENYHRIGYQVWFAEIISPSGEVEKIESNSYR